MGKPGFKVHLQAALMVLEEQYQLTANTAHLFTAFQIKYKMAMDAIKPELR